MAQVPQLPVTGTVQRQGFTPTYQRSDFATPDAFGAGVGQAEQGLGQQVSRIGDVLEKHAQFMLQRQNEADANDLFIKADEEAGQIGAQFKTLQGKNAVDAYPKYQQDLETVRQKYLTNAPNSEVARNFDKDFKRRVGYMIVDGGYYSATQNKQYNVGTSEARAKLAAQDAAAAPFDDKVFQQSLDTAKKAARAISIEHGWGVEEANIAEREASSQVWTAKITSLSKTDPFRAREIFDKNKDQMDGLTQIKVNDQINQQIIRVGSRIEADKIRAQGYGVDDGLVDQVKKLEGYSAKPYADGRQTSSGYGTKVQPGDENLSPEDLKTAHESRIRTELGRAAEMVDNFAPNLPAGTRNALISLTYNSGGAWMTSGLGNKIRAGDYEGAKENFSQYTSFQGQTNPGLQARRATELTWWGGEATDRSASSDSRLATALDRASEVARKQFPDDPANAALYEDTLRTRISADFSNSQRAVKQIETANRNMIMSEVLPVGDKPGVTSLEQLSSAAQDAYSRLPAPDQYRVNQMLRKNATADVPLTSDRFNKFQEAMGQRITDPAGFQALDPTQLDIPRTLQAQIFNAQRTAAGKTDTSGITKAVSWATPQLRAAGVVRGQPNSPDAQKYNQFVGALDNEIRDFQNTNKKPPTEEDVQKMTSRLLTAQPQTGFWSYFSRDPLSFEVPADFTSKPQIINGQSIMVKDEFKKRYGREPTAAETKRLYDRFIAQGTQ